tara:strand:- start:1556 stop:1753 length:198 start_codon:yes stop_codon:yes gene_type:complete
MNIYNAVAPLVHQIFTEDAHEPCEANQVYFMVAENRIENDVKLSALWESALVNDMDGKAFLLGVF